ncbi:hypothetical protein CPAV1605_279 [seawater metagenome]|uniref:F-box domain-containing protein n=1 Tax=seawater metagenome TaxID=1561972 RepID=A0A5E8CIP9_9ZZZZ
MELFSLHPDLLNYIIEFIDLKSSMNIRLVCKYFNKSCSIELCVKKFYQEKTYRFFNKWYKIVKARKKSRQIFMEKIMIDIDFRHQYVSIHDYPYPHLCIWDNPTNYINRIFINELFFFNFLNKNYQSLLNLIQLTSGIEQINNLLNEPIVLTDA